MKDFYIQVFYQSIPNGKHSENYFQQDTAKKSGKSPGIQQDIWQTTLQN